MEDYDPYAEKTMRRSFVKGSSRIFDLSIEPTALLQPIQNLERSILRDYAPSENSAGNLSDGDEFALSDLIVRCMTYYDFMKKTWKTIYIRYFQPRSVVHDRSEFLNWRESKYFDSDRYLRKG
jgi:hypothetical protein